LVLYEINDIIARQALERNCMLYNSVIRQGSRVRPRIDRVRDHDSFSSCAEHLTTCFANNIYGKSIPQARLL